MKRQHAWVVFLFSVLTLVLLAPPIHAHAADAIVEITPPEGGSITLYYIALTRDHQVLASNIYGPNTYTWPAKHTFTAKGVADTPNDFELQYATGGGDPNYYVIDPPTLQYNKAYYLSNPTTGDVEEPKPGDPPGDPYFVVSLTGPATGVNIYGVGLFAFLAIASGIVMRRRVRAATV